MLAARVLNTKKLALPPIRGFSACGLQDRVARRVTKLQIVGHRLRLLRTISTEATASHNDMVQLKEFGVTADTDRLGGAYYMARQEVLHYGLCD
jgi:hypothetical protein